MRARLQWIGMGLVLAVGVAAVVPSGSNVIRPLDPIPVNALIERPPAKAKGTRIYALVIDVHRAKYLEVLVYRALGNVSFEPVERERSVAADNGNLSGAQLLRDSQQIATFAAAQAAGVDGVRQTGRGVRVTAVGRNGDNSPLRSGDVIVELNTERIRTFGELREKLERLGAGARPLVRLRGGRVLRLPPIAADLGEGPRRAAHALGMAGVETAEPGVAGVRVRWDDAGDVGGSSAGLASALAVYERLGGAALAPGKVVAATGEISSSGAVYGVGGVEQKARSASELGADFLLVAPANEEAARKHADGVQVIVVASLDQALMRLRRAARRR